MMTACDPKEPDENAGDISILSYSPMRISLMRILFSAIGIVVLATSACERKNDSWPPVSGQLHKEFREKQVGLEVLVDELAVNGYSSVAIWDDGSLRAVVYGSDGYEEVDIDDPQKWSDLFENAGVDTARYDADEVSLHNRFEYAGIFDDTVFDLEFVKSAETHTAPICESRLSRSTCGICNELIDSVWHLRISWYPIAWIREFDDLDDSNTEQFDEIMSGVQSDQNVCLEQFFDEFDPFETKN